MRENLLTPLEELLKVVKFYRGLYGGGGGGGREQTYPWLRCQQSRVKCFLLMDFFAMLQVWLNYINYILYGNKNIYFYLKAAGAML